MRREQKLAHEGHAKKERKDHVSVMTHEVVHLLAPKGGEIILDATGGAGGHSEALLYAAPQAKLFVLDADARAVETLQNQLKHFGARVKVIEANFKDCAGVLRKHDTNYLDKVVFDLGWNSTQLSSGRGFSFLHDEPLLMSYGARPASGFTAAEILNTWKEETIADAIFGYGEERYARKIAKAIVERREFQPISSTIELVEIIRDAVPPSYRHSRLHFATRTFQALRIAVNDELGVLKAGLESAWSVLAPGGRIAVITFHSIEDRVVKRLFLEFVKKNGQLLVKKPMVATREEIIHNPSARSAKLRGIQKI